jgi:hypothetical protein
LKEEENMLTTDIAKTLKIKRSTLNVLLKTGKDLKVL